MDLHEISLRLQEGNAKAVRSLVMQAVSEGIPAQDILQKGLLDGMSVVAEQFKNNEIFVPEVLVIARAMNRGMSILKPLMVPKDTEYVGRVCVGTVCGDLHDIGKNLVKLMMEGQGLEVIDLGTDVPAETFVKTAVERDCQVICCSALLTTTMIVMEDVVRECEKAGIRDKVKIMIGGAPVTETYCRQIGADAYTPDASSAAAKALEFCRAQNRSALTHRERMELTFAHREGDRVPVYPILGGVCRKLVGADYPTWSTDPVVCADSFLAAADRYDLDCLITMIDLSVECDAWGQKLIYPMNEAAHPDYDNVLIRKVSDYGKIVRADYRKSSRMMMQLEVCRRLVKEKKGEMPVIAFVFGPLGTLSMMRNPRDLFLDLYDAPEAVRHATWCVAETLSDYAAALCDAGVDAIMWDTLYASASIMSKEMWRNTEGGPMKMLAQTVRDHGCVNMIHNCGRKCYFDAQIEAVGPAAISFLYPPDDCADYAECKAKYGDRLTLMGAVMPSHAIIGTDEQWDEQCREQIDAMAAGGGFILATGCEYPANASLDRLSRMIEIAKNYGRYGEKLQ